MLIFSVLYLAKYQVTLELNMVVTKNHLLKDEKTPLD